MFGAALFGFGFLLWALRSPVGSGVLTAQAQRGVVMALLLGNTLALIVAFTQRASIWGTLSGWLTTGIYALLLIGYAYFLATK
jgi:hypothetical protein